MAWSGRIPALSRTFQEAREDREGRHCGQYRSDVSLVNADCSDSSFFVNCLRCWVGGRCPKSSRACSTYKWQCWQWHSQLNSHQHYHTLMLTNETNRHKHMDGINSHGTLLIQQQQRPFYGPLSGTTRVSRYQKKHSPIHHSDHHPILISFFHLPRSIASSLFKLRAWQSFCTTSFHVLFELC